MGEKIESRRHEPAVVERIKDYYHRTYITRFEDIPESFYDLQLRAARDRGYGNLEMTAEMKTESATAALQDQKMSLDVWLDYFFSKDSDSFPMWTKYWAFTGMVKLGKYNPENGSFASRSKGQMAPFPELNREALALVVDAVIKQVSGKPNDSITDVEFLALLKGASFERLYG